MSELKATPVQETKKKTIQEYWAMPAEMVDNLKMANNLKRLSSTMSNGTYDLNDKLLDAEQRYEDYIIRAKTETKVEATELFRLRREVKIAEAQYKDALETYRELFGHDPK